MCNQTAVWNGVFEDLCGVTADITVYPSGREFHKAVIQQVKNGTVWFTHYGDMMCYSGPFLIEICEKAPRLGILKVEDEQDGQLRMDGTAALEGCSRN
jgi:hypothetical protein